jgi:thioredoxin reductase (NADPH)
MTDKNILNEVYDIVIIGGGPAGFTAGIYASRAGMKTLLISGASSVSQISITDLIENYPGIPDGINGYDLMELLKKQAKQFGTEIIAADVSNIAEKRWGETAGWEIKTADVSYSALAVIIATGAYWRKLGVPGEEAFIGRGVSFCATCDGPFYRNREVAVVGGGNTAIQEALFLTHFASKVTLIHRRDRLRAAAILQKKAFANEKIEFAWNSIVEEVYGESGVEGIKTKNLTTGESRLIQAEGVFIFIGLIPNTQFVKGLVNMEKDGSIIVDGDMRTSVPGIFAGGDCINKSLRQVVTACGDGATAAYAAQLFVEALKGESY